MSGICGLWRRGGAPVQPDEIERMAATLAHRGPNGGRTWYSSAAALAHQMLYTTPESKAERLPLEDGASGVVITADVRLDNREELVEALGIGADSSIPDSRLLLAAYAKWGTSLAEHLLGDFAFAIWDSNRAELICVRDHFGVKPLYYCQTPELVAFASEIKALLALKEIPQRLNEQSVAAYLCDDYRDISETFYAGILRVPPGHTLIASWNGVRLERYWALDPAREVACRTDEEYEEQFRSLFADAVRVRCRTARSLGSELSGGLDSSAITCVARDLAGAAGRGPLATFSICFPGTPECDEGPFIRGMVTRGGIDPHYISAETLSPFDDWERIAWHLDEPWSLPGFYLHWGLYRAACRQGVGVLLDGLDGDATVSHGEGYLLELARSGRWYRWLREASGLRRVKGATYGSMLWHDALPAFGSAARMLRQPEPRTIPGTLAFPLAAAWQQAHKHQHPAVPPGVSAHRLRHYLNLTSGALTHSLEVADKAAAAFGIEVRHPFLDKRLVEFCLALPGGQKLSRGWDRSIMRRALHRMLPGEIRWRPDKTDLRPHYRKRLIGANSQVLERAAEAATRAGARYLDSDAVKNVRRTYAANRRRTDDTAVWNSALLALWLEAVGVESSPVDRPETSILYAAAGSDRSER